MKLFARYTSTIDQYKDQFDGIVCNGNGAPAQYVIDRKAGPRIIKKRLGAVQNGQTIYANEIFNGGEICSVKNGLNENVLYEALALCKRTHPSNPICLSDHSIHLQRKWTALMRLAATHPLITKVGFNLHVDLRPCNLLGYARNVAWHTGWDVGMISRLAWLIKQCKDNSLIPVISELSVFGPGASKIYKEILQLAHTHCEYVVFWNPSWDESVFDNRHMEGSWHWDEKIDGSSSLLWGKDGQWRMDCSLEDFR